MGEIEKFISEKSINYWIRFVLRLMAWVVLMFYMVFRIIKPVVANAPIHLDMNDGWIIGGCLAILLAIEAVKMAVERWANKK
jgi:hypothetical protein